MDTLLLTFDLAGVLVFATSGALVAVRRRLDIVGVIALATLTALGGGWIRDVLIGAVPPAALADWRYLVVAMLAGVLTFVFHPAMGRRQRTIDVVDAFGLGLFAVAGALKAEDFGLGPLPAVLLGILTAVGGGVMRDVVVQQTPTVFGPGPLYAIPAAAGATIVVLGERTAVPIAVVAVIAGAVTVAWRLLALFRGWRAPIART